MLRSTGRVQERAFWGRLDEAVRPRGSPPPFPCPCGVLQGPPLAARRARRGPGAVARRGSRHERLRRLPARGGLARRGGGPLGYGCPCVPDQIRELRSCGLQTSRCRGRRSNIHGSFTNLELCFPKLVAVSQIWSYRSKAALRRDGPVPFRRPLAALSRLAGTGKGIAPPGGTDDERGKRHDNDNYIIYLVGTHMSCDILCCIYAKHIISLSWFWNDT